MSLVDAAGLTVSSTVHVTDPSYITGSGTNAWVVSSNTAIDQIVTAGERVNRLIDLAAIGRPIGLALTGTDITIGLVAVGTGLGVLLEVDESRGAVHQQIQLPQYVAALTSAGGVVYLVMQSPSRSWTLARLTSGGVETIATLPANLDAPTIAVSPPFAWMADNAGNLYVLDTDDELVRQLAFRPGEPVVALSATATRLWVLTSTRLIGLDVDVHS